MEIKLSERIVNKYTKEACNRAFFFDRLNINYQSEDGDVEIIKIINGKFKDKRAIITYRCFFPIVEVLSETDWLIVTEPYSLVCERILKVL
jgi:hypothetical protein